MEIVEDKRRDTDQSDSSMSLCNKLAVSTTQIEGSDQHSYALTPLAYVTGLSVYSPVD